ncbi:arrestin domain-containing protein 17-like [Saccostrea echinata]|uniref:arrestin domain-containing protein 17-like n=1 Tax=Saccostrea echinata TaxID=191078 RepID=UPI002A803B4A|nr:arrestin domain-containing protein 17-like [Saccostrea echinata]
MVKLKSFNIDLDNKTGVYMPGQTVSGKTILELETEMELREIRLECDGKAHVAWSEHIDGGDGIDKTKHYSGNEEYFDTTIPVFGKGLGSGDENRLPAGKHVFPFSFVLPPELPSSFEGEHGYVRYKVEGIIDRPWAFDEHTVQPFTVLATLDLNLEPSAANGGEAQNSENICCLCCKSGPILGTFKLNRVGYVPGESIYFEASAQNSSRRVCNVFADLEMVTKYYAIRPKKRIYTETKLINRIQHQDLAPGQSDVWSGDRFVIPPLAPSYLGGCSIIDIKYSIKLVIKPHGPSSKLHIPIEVIIGSIPLQSVIQQYQKTISTDQKSTPPIIPTPIFSESVWGPTNIKKDEKREEEHIYGQLEFTPCYSFYKFS